MASGGSGSHPHAGTSAGGRVGTGGEAGVSAAGGAAAAGSGGVEHTVGSGGSPGSGGAGGANGVAGGVAGGDASSLGGAGGATDLGDSSCLDGITDYENTGPFEFEAKKTGQINFWIPRVRAGCKVPVVHFANGTGATCSNYQGALERLATHGFLTACYESPTTAAGEQGLMAFTAALAMFPELAARKFGATGHEVGGQGAFLATQLAEEKWGSGAIYAALAMEPASGSGTQPSGGGTWQDAYAKIKSPTFMFSGSADMLVPESWVQQAYSAFGPDTEIYWWSAVGATQIPVPTSAAQQVSIPWFRWKLLGDVQACEFFKQLPDGPDWDTRMSHNEKPCS